MRCLSWTDPPMSDELLAVCRQDVGVESLRNAHDPDTELSRLYERFVDDVYRFVARRLGPELAFDVTAETFRIACERLGTFDARQGSERGWLYGIAMNVIRNHWRAEQRRLRALARIARDGSGTDEAFDRVDDGIDACSRLARVLDVVAELSPDDRDLLLLYAWERCSYHDMAAATGIPVGTVRSRLNRIRTTITAHIEVLSHE